MSIRALTFDLDDTLWPVRPALVRAEKATWAWLKDNASRITNRYSPAELAEARYKLIVANKDLHHQISQSRISSMEYVALECGYNQAEANSIALAAFEIFLHNRQQVDCYEGVEQMIGQLANNFIIGAISNGNADVHKTIIGKYFRFAISAEQVNASKPAAKIYQAALENIRTLTSKELEPKSVIHVGDNYSMDIEGAKQCGFTTVWLKNNEDGEENTKDNKCADIIISDILQLPGAIARLRNQ